MKHVFAPGRASALTIMGSFPGCQAVAENKQPRCVPSAQMPAPCVTSGLDGGQCTLRGPPGTPIRFNPLGTKRCQRSLAPCRSLSSAGVLTVVGFILSSDLEKARLSFFLCFCSRGFPSTASTGFQLALTTARKSGWMDFHSVLLNSSNE